MALLLWKICLIILIAWLLQVWWLAGLRLWRVAGSRHSSRLWRTEHWNGRQVWFFTRVQLCDNENNPIGLHSYQSYTMCICAEYVLLLELPQSNRYYWMRWPPKKWQSSQIWGRVDCGNIIHAFPSFCWSSASRALPKSAMNLLKHDGLQLQPVLETGNEQKNHSVGSIMKNQKSVMDIWDTLQIEILLVDHRKLRWEGLKTSSIG